MRRTRLLNVLLLSPSRLLLQKSNVQQTPRVHDLSSFGSNSEATTPTNDPQNSSVSSSASASSYPAAAAAISMIGDLDAHGYLYVSHPSLGATLDQLGVTQQISAATTATRRGRKVNLNLLSAAITVIGRTPLLEAVKLLSRLYFSQVPLREKLRADAPHSFRGFYQYVGAAGAADDQISAFTVGKEVADSREAQALRLSYYAQRCNLCTAGDRNRGGVEMPAEKIPRDVLDMIRRVNHWPQRMSSASGDGDIDDDGTLRKLLEHPLVAAVREAQQQEQQQEDDDDLLAVVFRCVIIAYYDACTQVLRSLCLATSIALHQRLLQQGALAQGQGKEEGAGDVVPSWKEIFEQLCERTRNNDHNMELKLYPKPSRAAMEHLRALELLKAEQKQQQRAKPSTPKRKVMVRTGDGKAFTAAVSAAAPIAKNGNSTDRNNPDVPAVKIPTTTPRQPPLLRLATHRDLTLFTFITQDAVSGLEVRDKTTGEFLPVPLLGGSPCRNDATTATATATATPPALLVNAGVFLQALTNGLVEATPHRVVFSEREGSNNRERCSVVFFSFPDHAASLEPLTTAVRSGEQGEQGEGKQEEDDIAEPQFQLAGDLMPLPC